MAERTIKTRDGMTHHVSVYNVRDQIGHFVAPRSQRGHPCHHRCCSGKRQWLRAEGATNGFMLNKAGQRAGINERTLFNGPESRVKKYASPELIDFFEANGRPTRTSWFGTATQRRAEYASSRMGR